MSPTNNRYIVKLTVYLWKCIGGLLRLQVARCATLPSAVLDEWFNRIPYRKRLFSCNEGEIEAVDHVILCSPFYQDVCLQIITPLINRIPRRQAWNMLRW